MRKVRHIAVLVLASGVLVAALAWLGPDRKGSGREEVDDAGYQQSQARIGIGSGVRTGPATTDSPLDDGERRAQSRRDRRRAKLTLKFLRAADPESHWRVRRVVIAPGATWVFTDLGVGFDARPVLVAACRALVDRFEWSDVVSIIGDERTPDTLAWVLAEGETRSDCRETVVEQQR